MRHNGFEIGKRQPTPVPIREREIITKPILTIEQWGPERVKEYLAEKYPRKKPKRKHERVYQWDKRKDEDDMSTAITMTKDEYLAARLAGAKRTEIGKRICDEFHVSTPTFYKQLNEWGIKEFDAEERALELFNMKSLTANNPSPELIADLKKAIEEAAPSTEPVKTGTFVIGAEEDNGVIISNASITPLTPAPEINSEPSSEAVEPSDEPEPTPVSSEPQTMSETVQYVTVRIPVKRLMNPNDRYKMDRGYVLNEGIEYLQRVTMNIWDELTDILGPGDYTEHVQQFIERKVAQL